MSLGGWIVGPGAVHGELHVTPIDDLREHSMTILCWCNPRRHGEDHGVVMHNSLDRGGDLGGQQMLDESTDT
jgi:hypothetical protein